MEPLETQDPVEIHLHLLALLAGVMRDLLEFIGEDLVHLVFRFTSVTLFLGAVIFNPEAAEEEEQVRLVTELLARCVDMMEAMEGTLRQAKKVVAVVVTQVLIHAMPTLVISLAGTPEVQANQHAS